MVRYIGMDVHREFAQLAVVEDGLLRDLGRIAVTPEALRSWAGDLGQDDEVALEATGNSDAIANLLIPIVGRVVVSNPSKTRAIAEAKVKTDKVDARILAQLLAADFLPPVWLPDDRTRALRRQVTRRAHLVRLRTRIKNQVHAILARNLAPTPPVSGRRNLPDRVSESTDYHDVPVDYLLTNRLKNGKRGSETATDQRSSLTRAARRRSSEPQADRHTGVDGSAQVARVALIER